MAQVFSDHDRRVYLREIKLNRGGYTRQGVYYGVGQRLYYIAALNEDEDDYIYEDEFRARDRQEAIEIGRCIFPNGKFKP